MKNEWCRIIIIDEKQVLFRRYYESDEDKHKMTMTINGPDWVKDTEAGEVSMSYQNDSHPYTKEQFDLFANKEAAKRQIENSILPALSAI